MTAPVTTDAPAKIIVSLPADAKLTIDGAVTSSKTDRRTFVSPALETGKAYTYTFQAEFVRAGKAVVVKKDVKVQAGAEVNVALTEALASR